MTGEPTVQVPVSKLYSIATTVGEEARTLAVDALLSQPTPTVDRDALILTVRDASTIRDVTPPTPTAEPDPCPRCGGTGEAADDSRRHTGLPTVGRCDLCEGTGRVSAAPPSIPDMVPGTRCREEVSGTVPSWAGEDQISPCLCVLDAGHNGRHKCDHQVGPSTISDVTPPTPTAETDGQR